VCCDYRNAKGGEPVGLTLLAAWRDQRDQIDRLVADNHRLRVEANRANLVRWESMLGVVRVG
jgi:hypothetical protein